MTDISKDEVVRLARLARLNLNDDEIDLYAREISAIFSYIEVLKTADLDNEDPTYSVHGLHNVVRDDSVEDSQPHLMENVHSQEDGLIKVPRMVG